MAVRFDTVGEKYSATNGLPSNVYTFCAWIRHTGAIGTGQGNKVVYWLTTGADVFTGIEIRDNGTADIQAYDSNTYAFNGLGPLAGSVDVWYRVALVINGANATFYRSAAGNALGSASVSDFTTPASPNEWFIGDGRYDEWFNGRIAAVKIWSAALTQAEVEFELAQYAPKRIANLLRFHPFVKAETVDYSGSGNTLSGGTGTSTEDGPPIPWQVKDLIVILPAGSSSQTVVAQVIAASSTLFNPTVVPQSVTVSCQSIDASSTLFNPTVIQVVKSPVLNTSTIVFEPAVIPGSVNIVLPVIDSPSTLLNPAVEYIVQSPVINTSSTIFEPSVVNLLQIINTQLIQASSVILSPTVSGGGVYVAGSIMDKARTNMLTELILTEPQFATNSDLMRQVIIDPGQTTITVTDASAANQLWRYLVVVRDS